MSNWPKAFKPEARLYQWTGYNRGMPITVADVRAISAGAFKALDDTEIEPFIEIADCMIDESICPDGACSQKIKAFIAAHFLVTTQTGAQGASGAVTQASAGGLNVQYAQSQTAFGDHLATTRFGQAAQLLLKSCGVAGYSTVIARRLPSYCCPCK